MNLLEEGAIPLKNSGQGISSLNSPVWRTGLLYMSNKILDLSLQRGRIWMSRDERMDPQVHGCLLTMEYFHVLSDRLELAADAMLEAVKVNCKLLQICHGCLRLVFGLGCTPILPAGGPAPTTEDSHALDR
ncbi:hypothetical protein BW38_03531 [Stenotrophomonas sp. RIT309]|nr:hypothetical protein BW38_03531 [Stenotrophomonas sp. RIT309]